MARRSSTLQLPRIIDPELPDVLDDAGILTPRMNVVGVQLDLLTGQVHASHSSLAESLIPSAAVDDIDFTGTRLTDVLIQNLRAAQLRAHESSWRAVTFAAGRIGSLDLRRAELSSVVFRGMRIDYVALPSARLNDVLFDDCEIGTLDLPEAQLSRVQFLHSRADEVDTRGLHAADLDLRGLEALSFTDPRGLAGGTLSPHQAQFHSAAFARTLGIHVEP